MADIMISVAATLRAAGYRTGEASPGSVIPEITGPVVAVSLEKVDTKALTLVVRATVVSPYSLGARTCETNALKVCKLLGNMGGACQLQPCQFNAKSEMFSVAVLVTFHGNVLDEQWMPGDLCQVRFGSGYYLNRIASVTAWQEAAANQELEAASWHIRVEERMDGIIQEQVPVNVANVTVFYQNSREIYNECRLIGRKRVFQDGTLLQVWDITARSREVGD